MKDTAKNRAYQRGLKAAVIWKGTKNRLKCISRALRFLCRYVPDVSVISAPSYLLHQAL